jgi:hypothetical protein
MRKVDLFSVLRAGQKLRSEQSFAQIVGVRLAKFKQLLIMLVTIIIICTIILVVKACKPDKKNQEQNEISISQLPEINIQASSRSTMMQKLKVGSDSALLRTFSFSDGYIKIVMRDGDSIKAPLAGLTSSFSLLYGQRRALVSYHGKELFIVEGPDLLSDRDWDRVFYVLSLSGKTYYVETISKSYKTQVANYKKARAVLKIIEFLQG